MDIFEACREINELIEKGEDSAARDELILMLDYHHKNGLKYSPLVNHLIRDTGLYPYLQLNQAYWQERFIYQAFRINTGGSQEATLHREQALLLSRLLDGENIAVSAPTSFGKSFVIDAYIHLKKPACVMIIVPTIALTDETRRRLYRKFAKQYNFVTTADAELSDRNIFIFPAERAINYLNRIENIDLLVVDEFYKASSRFDKERAPDLLRAILKLTEKASQRYFLAPNISSLKDSVFTKDMEFVNLLGSHTVFLQRHDTFKHISNQVEKGKTLLAILSEKKTKSLIYAGTYTEIDKVANLLIESLPVSKKRLVNMFADWLTKNYEANWRLTNLARRAVGVHNGRLHRSLSQIQIKLFEEERGFDTIVSTSSIIEGVNTQAENVVIWRNKNGRSPLNDFTYKNIIGRGGRMFKHFVGQVYLLEEPPLDMPTELELPFPDEMLGGVDELAYRDVLTPDQIKIISNFKEEMGHLIGRGALERLLAENTLRLSDAKSILKIASDMVNFPEEWGGLGFLNSSDPGRWDRALYKALEMKNVADLRFSKFVTFVKTLSTNWEKSVSELLFELDEAEIGIDKFFQLERNAAFKLSAILSDINELQKLIFRNGTDISPFIFRLAHAFLPPVVYQLEEYGLPRMISRKIQRHQLINFGDPFLTLNAAVNRFQNIGKDRIKSVDSLDDFDRYIIDFFFEGITTEESHREYIS